MKRYRLIWPDNEEIVYRNSVLGPRLPNEIVCDEINYATIDGKPFGLNVWSDGDTEDPKFTFYTFPLAVEYLGEVANVS